MNERNSITKSRATSLSIFTLGWLLIAGCVSDFEFELPDEHPGRPVGSSGPLDAPSPFHLSAPSVEAPPPPSEPTSQPGTTSRPGAVDERDQR